MAHLCDHDRRPKRASRHRGRAASSKTKSLTSTDAAPLSKPSVSFDAGRQAHGRVGQDQIWGG